jgi:hypothetical protein
MQKSRGLVVLVKEELSERLYRMQLVLKKQNEREWRGRFVSSNNMDSLDKIVHYVNGGRI